MARTAAAPAMALLVGAKMTHFSHATTPPRECRDRGLTWTCINPFKPPTVEERDSTCTRARHHRTSHVHDIQS